MAIWFLNFSTWLGRHGIYLEDLYVTPGPSGRTVTARRCSPTWPAGASSDGYGRLEWSVLDWNTPAIDFYVGLGATGMDEWTIHRLSGDALVQPWPRRRPPQ